MEKRDRDTRGAQVKRGIPVQRSEKKEPPGENAGRSVALISEGLGSETDPAGLNPWNEAR